MEGRPEIRYPCEWEFCIIGMEETHIRALVAATVTEIPFELVQSHTSARGNYVSMKLTLEVRDEAHRNSLYEQLAADEGVKMVM